MSTFDQHLEKLFEFLRIPSISSLPEYANDMVIAAQFLEKELESLGFKVSFHWPKGKENTPPLVFAEKISDPSNPTVLLYGHYDVQPVGDLNLWPNDPFEPEITNGEIRARGAADDKGQIMTHLAAFEELNEEWGENWPINVKVIFEGEEELGSPHAPLWLKDEDAQQLLACDIAVVSDTGFATKTVPAITYGLRGLLYFVIDVTLGSSEVHSGEYGGGVLNPAHALFRIFDKLYDLDTGKILVPGFYDDVVDVREGEREKLEKVPFDQEEFYKDAGNAEVFDGESEYTLKERITARPTLDVSGIWGGDISSATKTSIPASVHAKFGVRSVANQDPKTIGDLIISYIYSIAPKGVKVNVQLVEYGDGLLVDINSQWFGKVAKALEQVFGEEPVFDRVGGSISMVTSMQKHLHVDPILFGYSLPGDGIHTPHEKLDVEQFKKGIEANKLIYKAFAEK